HLFGGIPANIQYGAAHYRRRTQDTSTVLNQLFESYAKEGVVMPYTIEDFRRDFTKEHLDLLSPDELIEGLTPQQARALRQKHLKGLSLPEMEAVVEELKQEIERSKASRQAGKRPARRKQERTEPNRPSSRRKRKET